MKIWTFDEAKTKIQKDMDLEEETFIDDPEEYYGYFNEAIDDAEAEIHRLYQYYFKSQYPLPWATAVSRYSMPSDIYANKILYLQYENGTERYPVERIKNKEIAEIQDSDYYLYDIEYADVDTGVELIFYPPPRGDGGEVKMYYLRNANRMTATDSKIDIPEFINFIFAHVKVSVAIKEMNPMLQAYVGQREQQRMLMKQTLDNMILDEDLVIDPDMSFYEEFV